MAKERKMHVGVPKKEDVLQALSNRYNGARENLDQEIDLGATLAFIEEMREAVLLHAEVKEDTPAGQALVKDVQGVYLSTLNEARNPDDLSYEDKIEGIVYSLDDRFYERMELESQRAEGAHQRTTPRPGKKRGMDL
ncbi:MAG: hypothetical protein HY053_01585 [Proteobacteria bacterium]|nr:hypothetical protein [Pseudomonadota bacterium]